MPEKFDRCLQCMHKLGSDFVCKKCGFDNSSYTVDEKYLQPESTLHNRYLVGKLVGEGQYGLTYIGWDNFQDNAVAIKEYFPSELVNRDTKSATGKYVQMIDESKEDLYKEGLSNYVSETKKLSMFNGFKGIVQVLDSFMENGTAYIIMEFVTGKTVRNYIRTKRRVEPKRVFNMMKPVIESLEKIHKIGMYHYNINPDDIIIRENGAATLINFDTARGSSNDEGMSLLLKTGFAPYEQYFYDGVQGAFTDVYAISAVIYFMITGEVPQEAVERGDNDTLKSVEELKIPIPKSQNDALMKGLAVYSEDRFQTIGELYEGLYKNISPMPGQEGESEKKPLPRSANDDAMDAFIAAREETEKEMENNTRSSLKERLSGVSDVMTKPIEIPFGKKQSQSADDADDLIKALRGMNDDVQADKDAREGKVHVSPEGVKDNSSTDSVKSANLDKQEETKKDSLAGSTTGGYSGSTASSYKAPVPPVKKDYQSTSKDDYDPMDALTSASNDDSYTRNRNNSFFEQYKKFIIIGGIVLVVIIIAIIAKSCSKKSESETVTVDYSSSSTTSTTQTSSDTTSSDTSEATTEPQDDSSDVTMPDVKGKKEDDAKAAIKEADDSIEVKTEEAYDSKVDKGKVISQSVEAGKTYKKGEESEVVLKISKGEEKIKVPSVKGKSESSAKDAIKKAGLKAKVKGSEYSSKKKGTVISQKPSSGSKVKKGSEVKLTLSKGSKPKPKAKSKPKPKTVSTPKPAKKKTTSNTSTQKKPPI